MSNIYHQRFHQRLDALRAYANEHGHSSPPLAHIQPSPHGPIALGRWVAYLRASHRKGLLPPDRQAPLETLPGWTWEPRRPGPQPNLDRNTAVRDMRNQGASLDHIAEQFGLSKQRVHQLVKRGY